MKLHKPFVLSSEFAIRLLPICILLLVGCREWFFKRDPDVTPLRLDVESYAYSPVWDHEGEEVYFIASVTSLSGGSLKAMRSDGSGERLVRDGTYGSVCVSHSGAMLAVVAEATRGLGGPLLLLDTTGLILDTLSTPAETVVTARFDGSDDGMYFYLHDWGVVHIDFSSQKRDTVVRADLLLYLEDFDVSGDSLLALPGSIYHLRSGVVDSMPELRQPRFNPLTPTLMLGVLGSGEFRSDMVMYDRFRDSLVHLDARPYYACDLLDPAWSHGGERVLLSAAELYRTVPDVVLPRLYGLWVFAM